MALRLSYRFGFAVVVLLVTAVTCEASRVEALHNRRWSGKIRRNRLTRTAVATNDGESELVHEDVRSHEVSVTTTKYLEMAESDGGDRNVDVTIDEVHTTTEAGTASMTDASKTTIARRANKSRDDFITALWRSFVIMVVIEIGDRTFVRDFVSFVATTSMSRSAHNFAHNRTTVVYRGYHVCET